ncbi:hypothetical protein FisN_1Lu447, partial [Fistulifera solaris]
MPADLFDVDADEQPEPEEPRPDLDDYTPEAYDHYINSEIQLLVGGELRHGVVKRRVKNDDGIPIGSANENPILDTRYYEVEFPDGTVDSYSANIIAENLYAQIDDEGRMFAVLSEIVDHRKNGHAVSKENGFLPDGTGSNPSRKITTRGWELLCEWKDGSSDWVRLSDIKESHPVQVALYAVGAKIDDEPAFAWWVPHVIRKKDRIIAKTKNRYWKRTHKYGVRLPKTVAEALQIDRDTGTDYWRKAIEKEMKNVSIAFEFNAEDLIPVGHKEIKCHMIFDVKITLVRKARFVADGHKVNEPKENTFSSVVSRDSVRLFFLLAALNNLKVLSADIQNAYLTAPIKEKYWYRTGLEFGSNQGRPAKIVRALYGLPSAGFRFRSHLASKLRELGYTSCKADPDIWMRPALKPDGTKYYEYLLAYVDDLVGQSIDPDKMFGEIAQIFQFKDGKAEEPELYLGADVKKWHIDDAEDPTKDRWALSSEKYTKKAISEVETELNKVHLDLPKKAATPFSAGYRPELDVSPELDDRRQNYFQGLIGVLRWLCELGRLDIIVPVSMLSRYLAQAREGHLDQVFHIFAYLKSHDRSTLVFDDTRPFIDDRRFIRRDWSEFYPDAAEVIPPDKPEERVALKIAVEMIEGLRYKLRMMGVPIEGSTSVFCDNDSVVKNTTHPESPLKKKANAVAYHKVREAIAAGIIRLTKEDGETNLSDILTKLLGGPRLRDLSSRV